MMQIVPVNCVCQVMGLRFGADGEAPGQWPRGMAAQDDGQGRAPRILIVEDDWFIAMDIQDLVSDAGYDVLDIATSADEAVRAAVAGKPDLVLMDIRLLGPRDGIDAALAIRERVDVPCLMVSAHQDARLKARAAAARPCGWVQKPFSNQQLLAAIDAALQGAAGD